jgi:6-phosphogluconate dehydrogenase
MVHNGIEYGQMAALAEGMGILERAHELPVPDGDFDLDVASVLEVWRRGSVVSSWLVDLTAAALHADPELAGFTGEVADSGEGRWTVQAAVELGVPAHVLTSALYDRFASRGRADYSNRSLTAMRNAFGGHLEGVAK